MAAALERDLWQRLKQMLALRLWSAFDADLMATFAPAHATQFGSSLTGPNACLIDT